MNKKLQYLDDNIFNIIYNNKKYKVKLLVEHYNPDNNPDALNFSYADVFISCENVPPELKREVAQDIRKKLLVLFRDPTNNPYSSSDNNDLYNVIFDLLTDSENIVSCSKLFQPLAQIEFMVGSKRVAMHLVTSDRVSSCNTPYEALWEKHWQTTGLLKPDLHGIFLFKPGTKISHYFMTDKWELVGLESSTMKSQNFLGVFVRKSDYFCRVSAINQNLIDQIQTIE